MCGRILNEAYLSAIKRANKGCFTCTFVSVFLMLLNQTVIDCLIRGLIQLRIRFYRTTSKYSLRGDQLIENCAA